MTDWLAAREFRDRRRPDPSEAPYRTLLRKKREHFLKLAAENAKAENGVVAALRNTHESVFFFDPAAEEDESPLVSYIYDVVGSNSARELGPIGENMDSADVAVLQALVEMTPDEFWKSRAASAVGPLAFQNVDVLSVLVGTISRKNMRTRHGAWTSFALQVVGASRWYNGSDSTASLLHALMRQTAMSTDPWKYSDSEKHILHQIMFGVLESHPELIYKSVARESSNAKEAPVRTTPIGVYIQHLPPRSLLRAPPLLNQALGSMEAMVSDARVREAEVENARATFDHLLEVRNLTDKQGTIAWNLNDAPGMPLLTMAANTGSLFILQRIYNILTPEEREQTDFRGRTAKDLWKIKMQTISDLYDPVDPSEEQKYRYENTKAIYRVLQGRRPYPAKRA